MLALSVSALAFSPALPALGRPSNVVIKMSEEAPAPAPAPPAPSKPKAAPTPDMSLSSIGAALAGERDGPWTADSDISDLAGMKALAIRQNPVVGFWDPLEIITAETSPETIGWFRHAEIKHGRVAMAGFVGFMIQSAGIHWPWACTGLSDPSNAVTFADISAAGGPGDQWDALPAEAKAQIICAVGFLEVIGETSAVLEANGQKHYVRGGKPGYYPPFSGYFNENYWPHPLPINLFDPAGFTKKMTPERKEKALLAEVNNGRLAMIGLFGALSASKGLIVPGLDSLPIKPYSGEYMGPFTVADAAKLPFVDGMVNVAFPWN